MEGGALTQAGTAVEELREPGSRGKYGRLAGAVAWGGRLVYRCHFQKTCAVISEEEFSRTC
jgi:hypothetical protein